MSATRPCAAAIVACAIAFGCGARQATSDAERDVDASAGAADASTPVDARDDAPVDATAADAPIAEADADADADADAFDAHDAPSATDATYLDAIVGDGGGCNALANTAPPVAEIRIAGEAPAASGGTFVPGLYYLTRWEVYTGDGGATGPTGNTRAHAMSFHATTYDEVLADNGGVDQRAVRTWSFSGTSLDSQELCPTVDDLGDDYTATPTTLVLQAYGVVFTFTKQ